MIQTFVYTLHQKQRVFSFTAWTPLPSYKFAMNFVYLKYIMRINKCEQSPRSCICWISFRNFGVFVTWNNSLHSIRHVYSLVQTVYSMRYVRNLGDNISIWICNKGWPWKVKFDPLRRVHLVFYAYLVWIFLKIWSTLLIKWVVKSKSVVDCRISNICLQLGIHVCPFTGAVSVILKNWFFI